MPTTKNATIRYQALDRCMRNPGRRYNIDDLVDACNDALTDFDPSCSGVKKRQVYDDLRFMQDSKGFSAPIETFKEGRIVYYHYDDTNFSINNQPLNEQEAQQLKEALLTISRFKGMPQFEWIEEMQVRLEHAFKLNSDKKVIEFEENIFLKGREHIANIYNSIIQNQCINIKYKPFNGELMCVTLSPYYLKEFNNRWFLFALNHNEKKIMNLALDRIQSIENCYELFITNTFVDFDEYFEDVIGVSVPENASVQKIILKIDSNHWPYIETKPLHGSQKIKEINDHYTIIELTLIPNYELEALIFSHTEKIEVIYPESFRKHIKSRILNLNEKYL
jgi:predicted DNA-binding transcriptional regulator YafY